MHHSTKSPPETPPRKPKYVPLLPLKPLTEDQLAEETAAFAAVYALYALGRGGLAQSMWAPENIKKRAQAAAVSKPKVMGQDYKRVQVATNALYASGEGGLAQSRLAPEQVKKRAQAAAVSKPKVMGQDYKRVQVAANARYASGEGGLAQSRWAPQQYNKPVQVAAVSKPKVMGANDSFGIAANISPPNNAGILHTPPTTPPAGAPGSPLRVMATVFIPAQSSQAPSSLLRGTAPAFKSSQSAQAPVVPVLPPHLRGIATAPLPPAPVVTVLPPHLRGIATAPRQSAQAPVVTVLPPHLRGIATAPLQSAQAPVVTVLPPHLRGTATAPLQSAQAPVVTVLPPHLRGIATAPLQSAQAPVVTDLPHLRGTATAPLQSAQAPVVTDLPHLRGTATARIPSAVSVAPHLRGVVAPQPQPIQSSAAYSIPHLEGSANHSTQLIPPHLRLARSGASAQFGTSAQLEVSPPIKEIHPAVHLRLAQSSASTRLEVSLPIKEIHPAVPPHLRLAQSSASTQLEVSLPIKVIHPAVPPHLRVISSTKSQSSTATTNTTTTTQVILTHSTTPSPVVLGTTMAPSFSPAVSQVEPAQDAFTKWFSQKRAPKKIETVGKAAEKVTIKSDQPSQPIRSSQMSPPEESVNSNRSQGKHMQTKVLSKKYDVDREAASRQRLANVEKIAMTPRWKLDENTQANFENYIKNRPTAYLAPSTAQGNTVHGSANIRAAKAQAAQVVAPNLQSAYQKPTFNGAQSLGRNIMQDVQRSPAQKPAPVVMKIEHASPGLKNIAPKKPTFDPNTNLVEANKWQGMPSMQAVAAMISSDINNIQPESDPNAPPLTETALVLQTGFKTADQNEHRISSSGLNDISVGFAPDPRHTQGNDTVEQLKDWDGTWAAAPLHWETERPRFDGSFIPGYIKQWQRTLPSGLQSADIHCVEFTSGINPINNVVFIDPINQGADTIPDNQSNTPDEELKRVWQTSMVEANNYMVAFEKGQRQEERAIKASNMRFREFANREPELNPFRPSIDIYIRPAEEKDAAGVVAIYNWYISNTNIPEDQAHISPEDGKWLIKQAKEDNLPFLVAIKGRQPTSVDAQGRPAKKIIMPAVESVIGFCFPERFNYGFIGSRKGRSRATATLQLYIHHEHTRKGVGRNLLDRLIHCLNPGYAYKNAAAWINPSKDKLHETEGAGMFHQLLFQIPVEPDHDPNIDWQTKFLLKFHFKEKMHKEGDVVRPSRLTAVARSSAHGCTAHFLDLATFSLVSRLDGEFDPYL